MAQIGFPLMLGHIACFLISLFFLFEQMFITAVAKWLPSLLVITDFWVQSCISGSWTWFPQMPQAWCLRDSPASAPVSGHAMQRASRSSLELLPRHFVHLTHSVFMLAGSLHWTEASKPTFFLKNATAAGFICHWGGCVVVNRVVRLPAPRLLWSASQCPPEQ